MIIVDTSGLLASFQRSDNHHAAAINALRQSRQRILSPFVLAELDYLLTELVGQQAELVMLRDVERGAYHLDSLNAVEIGRARAIVERYSDLGIGLTDASIVVLAERYGCRDILTLDQRHFRAMTTLSGQSFRLLPLDN